MAVNWYHFLESSLRAKSVPWPEALLVSPCVPSAPSTAAERPAAFHSWKGSASCPPAAELWGKVLHLSRALPATVTKLPFPGAKLPFPERPALTVLGQVCCLCSFLPHTLPTLAWTEFCLPREGDHKPHEGRASHVLHAVSSAPDSRPVTHTFLQSTLQCLVHTRDCSKQQRCLRRK